MKSKVATAIMAIGVTLGSTLSGLGSAAGVQASQARASASAVQVTMLATPSSDVVDLDTNWFTRYIEQQYNIRIKWVLDNGTGTKQSLVLASGDYPDVFWGGAFTPPQEAKYGQQGVLIPLNKYIHTYAPNIEKAMNDVPGMKRVMTAPDGNIYGIPAINWCWHCYWSSKYWINTTWLKELHLKMPTTTTQFVQVLQAFKTRRPGGVKNVIPLDGAVGGFHGDPTTFLMNAFIYDDGDLATADHFIIQQGKVAFAPIQPQWKQGLAFLHLLYQQGLINSESLTQQPSQQQSHVQQGTVGVFSSGCSCTAISYGAPGSHYQDWWPIPPLKGPNGVNYAAFYGQGPTSVQFAITNKATPDQIRAVMKLANFVYTIQGTTMLDFGPQGKYWNFAKDGQKGLDGRQAVINVAWNKFYSGTARQNWGWDQMGLMYQSKRWRLGGVAIPEWDPNGLSTMLQDMTTQFYAGHQPKEVYPAAVFVQPSQVQQYQLTQTNINSFVSQSAAQFITGSKDLNKDWGAYVQGVQNLGLQQYLQLAQSAMGTPFITTGFKGNGSGPGA